MEQNGLQVFDFEGRQTRVAFKGEEPWWVAADVCDILAGEGAFGRAETDRALRRQSDATEAHLLLCDERPGRGWDAKIYERFEKYGERDICVWGI